MKKLLIAALMLFASLPAFADRADDILSGDGEALCYATAKWYHAGAMSKIGGYARKFEPMTPMHLEMLEHQIPLPKDAMYVPEWDSMTDNEQKFLSERVLAGYDAAAEGKWTDNEQASKAANDLFNDCMAKLGK